MADIQKRLDALSESDSNDAEIDGLREIIAELQQEIRDFADSFPGNNDMWRSVQLLAKKLGT